LSGVSSDTYPPSSSSSSYSFRTKRDIKRYADSNINIIYRREAQNGNNLFTSKAMLAALRRVADMNNMQLPSFENCHHHHHHHHLFL
jgi:hypothetical protein